MAKPWNNIKGLYNVDGFSEAEVNAVVLSAGEHLLRDDDGEGVAKYQDTVAKGMHDAYHRGRDDALAEGSCCADRGMVPGSYKVGFNDGFDEGLQAGLNLAQQLVDLLSE